jgi:tRNA dimethylallyltransferase
MASSPLPLPPDAIFLAGPTAVGKSGVALRLAEALRGEIISVDSMQVYRGLDIGTAKPSAEERDRVRHHLIDVVDLSQSFDAAKFLEETSRVLQEITERGRTPIFCGGTGLYFKALLEGLGEGPAPDPVLRAELERTPLPELLAELARRDPARFERIDRHNPRRVIRAVETIRLTGRPASAQRAAWSSAPNSGKPNFVCLRRGTADLHRRIDVRVNRMFERGLVAETERLIEVGLAQNPTALQAIGYRQVAEHLGGIRSLEETRSLVKLRTRQFARRQMTWFRGQAHPRWLEVHPGETARELAGRLRGLLQR